MGLKIEILEDTATPSLLKYFESEPALKQNVLEAVALELQSYAVQSFGDPSKRVAPWAPKKDGKPSNLTKSTKLRQSIRVFTATASSAAVGSDAMYASAHQFGAPKRNLPRRAYFPLTVDGKLFAPFERRVDALVRRAYKIF